MTGCCPKCHKDYFYIFLNSKRNRNCIPEYMRIENQDNEYTIVATCQKCGTEFKFMNVNHNVGGPKIYE